MKVAPFDESAFHLDHPQGTVSFNYLCEQGILHEGEISHIVASDGAIQFENPRDAA